MLGIEAGKQSNEIKRRVITRQNRSFQLAFIELFHIIVLGKAIVLKHSTS